jgi:ABC-type uncharacterized transport system substrate-binding protein
VSEKFALRDALWLTMLLLVGVHLAEAQQPTRVPRIGYLSRDLHPADSRAPSPRNLEAFRHGLRELGYVEGKNIIIEYRYSDGRNERLPALAEELVGLKTDIIVADSYASANAAKQVTKTIPIIMTSGADPIATGLATSLSRPGGNITGLTNLTPQLLGKRIEVLKELVPNVSRFAVLDTVTSVAKPMFNDGKAAAQSLGVNLKLVEVRTPNPDLEGAFRVIIKERVGGLIAGTGPLGSSLYRKTILELVERNRLPAIYPSEPWVEDGGLTYYGANIPDLYRRAATYVEKILKGSKPANLPIEQPTKFELVVNLKAAKEIGLTIPQRVLLKADRVIK